MNKANNDELILGKMCEEIQDYQIIVLDIDQYMVFIFHLIEAKIKKYILKQVNYTMIFF